MEKRDLSSWCFENAFKPLTTALYIIRTHPLIPRNRIWLIQFVVLTTMNASCLFFLINSVFFHDVISGKYMDASKNLAMLVVCLNSNMKYYMMIYYRESIAGLIKTMDRDYESAQKLDEEEKNIILSYSKKGYKVSKIWVLVAISTSAIFPVKASCMMSYYFCKGEAQLVPMFDLTFPYVIERYKSEFWAFCGVFLLCFIFDCFAGLVYIGFEPMIPIFTLHTCGQLQLLSLRLTKVISESANEKELKAKFRSIVMKQEELYSFINHVQNNFMCLMEFNMKTSVIILPCNAFLLLQEFRTNHTINLEYIFLTIATFVHFLSPCYYCDLLMETSERFRQAVYSSSWEKYHSMSIQKTVLLMLTRAGTPFSISSIFYSINLDTFSIMCRQAYAIFNLMTACTVEVGN